MLPHPKLILVTNPSHTLIACSINFYIHMLQLKWICKGLYFVLYRKSSKYFPEIISCTPEGYMYPSLVTPVLKLSASFHFTCNVNQEMIFFFMICFWLHISVRITRFKSKPIWKPEDISCIITSARYQSKWPPVLYHTSLCIEDVIFANWWGTLILWWQNILL